MNFKRKALVRIQTGGDVNNSNGKVLVALGGSGNSKSSKDGRSLGDGS